MPIVSVCPYCSRGRVRTTEDAIGTAAKCPSCGSEFTVIPTDEAVASAAGSSSGRSSSPLPAVVAADDPPPKPRVTSPPAAEPTARYSVEETPPDAIPAPSPTEEADPESLPDPARLPGMAAVAVALAGVVAWMIPDFGRLVWLGLAIVATVVGGLSLLAADRKKLFAWIGLGTAGGSLFLCLVLPWLMGEGWWPERGYHTSEAVAVGLNGEQTDGRQLIDVTKAVWFKNGVRVSVVEVRRGPVDVTTKPAPNKKPVVKKVPDVLQVVVEVSNEGYPKPVPFTGWTDATPPVFRTGADADIGRKVFDGAVAGGPPATPLPLGIGVAAQQTLYFDPPPDGSGGGGKLELSVAAFGGDGEPVRFAVPYSAFKRSEFKPGGGR